MNEELLRDIFEVASEIRYVALSRDGTLTMRERDGLASASSSESDRYEELLVNPTLLALTRARGEIDCGGVRFLIVGYGSFHQLVLPISGGHVSIALEVGADPVRFVPRVLSVLKGHGLEAAQGASSSDGVDRGSASGPDARVGEGTER